MIVSQAEVLAKNAEYDGIEERENYLREAVDAKDDEIDKLDDEGMVGSRNDAEQRKQRMRGWIGWRRSWTAGRPGWMR